MVRATDGNFYGTTSLGGANGVGTVFEINPAGTLTTIHSFDRTDGANPFGSLCQATDGNFYGTTLGGGARNDGTVFRLSLALGPFLKTVPVAGKVATAVMILGTNLKGDYAVRRGNSDRASAVLPTQAEAIERARELNPNMAPLVERVRNTDEGSRDKWRKP